MTSAPLRNIIVQHPHFNEAVERVSDFERRTEAGERLILPILGPTRVGKNCCIETLQEKYPEILIDGVRHRRIILVKTPPKPTLRSLPESILLALGLRGWSSFGSNDALTAHARKILARCKTRYVIFDEIQHVIELRSNKTNRSVSDWLKNFLDETNISIILLGLPSAIRVLDSNEQLRDRALAPLHLLPYNWMVNKEQFHFREAIHQIFTVLVEDGFVINFHDELDIAFYISCGGRIGMVIKLLQEACSICREQMVISKSVLIQAHDRSVDLQTLKYNPFRDLENLTETAVADAFFSILLQSGYSNAHSNILTGRTATVEEANRISHKRREHMLDIAKRKLAC